MKKNFYPAYNGGALSKESYAALNTIDKRKSPSLISLPIEEARREFIEIRMTGKPDADIAVEKREIEEIERNIPAWIYTPKGEGPFPVVLFFHGGGFVLGALEEFNSFCTYIAKGAGALLISVGYRLAPEFKHPAQIEDAWSALNWLIANGESINADLNRIAVAGDSAGGNLAAVLSIIAREKNIKLASQVLVCPWLNLNSIERESYKFFGDGLWLSTEAIKWFRSHYLQDDSQAGSYKVSPGLLLDVSGLPPSLIVVAEFDVLRDEGEEFYRKLKGAGVPARFSEYKGMLHDFIILPGLFGSAREGIKEICDWIRSH